MKRLVQKSRSMPEQHALISFSIPSNLVGIAVGKELKNIKQLKRTLKSKEITFKKLAEEDLWVLL